jgi:hypothetical protein
MRGEDIQGANRVGNAGVQHMAEEERRDGAIQRHELPPAHRVARQDQLLVGAPAGEAREGKRVATRRGIEDHPIGKPTRLGQGGEALFDEPQGIVERTNTRGRVREHPRECELSRHNLLERHNVRTADGHEVLKEELEAFREATLIAPDREAIDPM